MQQLQQGATLQNGKYRIEKALGQGGFGITYLAMRTDTGSQVAIKELFVQGINDRKGNNVTISNPVYIQSFSHQKEKFSKEARRIHNIDNPHVVKVYDSFEENGTAYYTMQFVEGYSLSMLCVFQRGHHNTVVSAEYRIKGYRELGSLPKYFCRTKGLQPDHRGQVHRDTFPLLVGSIVLQAARR